jgi:lipopolysaccharide transport system permease protein
VPESAAPAPAERRVTVIAPPRGWRGLGLAELWAWRELLWALTWRDVRSRYRQAVLGILWALVRPLATAVIFAFVLGRLARVDADGRPYALFTYVGLLAYGLFASAVQGASHSIVHWPSLVTKVYVPRLLLPLSSIGAAGLDFLVGLIVVPPWLVAVDAPIGPALLLLPLVVVWTVFVAAAAGILLAGLVVRWRDFGHATAFLLQIGMYVTPVLYPLSLLPEAARPWAFVNPMTGPVEAFRACVLGSTVPVEGCLLSAASALVLLGVGLVTFRRLERRFADVLG